MTFSALGLSAPLLRALAEIGYVTPTPIQLQAIPAILAGRDVMAAAQTGTGKTAGFVLPLLQRLAAGPAVRGNHIRALVLTPTRELAVQVAASISVYGQHLRLKSAVVYGGVKINPQMMRLRGGVDVLVATPGRLLDLYRQNAVRFPQVETLVLDEADRMLAMGFSDQLGEILALLPKRRQNLLFCATFAADLGRLTEHLLHEPLRIAANPPNSTATAVTQQLYEVDKGKKAALLSHLLRSQNWEQVLVFVRSKEGAGRLVEKLSKEGISATAMHGDQRQGERSRALADFKAGRVRLLVATDLAARGLDIHGLPRVINFDLPKLPEDYVHRIGRTGRAGLQGEAISFLSADEIGLLAGIEPLIGQILPRQAVNGFAPTQPLVVTSRLTARPKRPKKPKQKRAAEDLSMVSATAAGRGGPAQR
jgi:ATP-dependent RNA helicase RhlE